MSSDPATYEAGILSAKVVSCSNINGYLRNYQDCLTLDADADAVIALVCSFAFLPASTRSVPPGLHFALLLLLFLLFLGSL
jgi:hypothetical protein